MKPTVFQNGDMTSDQIIEQLSKVFKRWEENLSSH